MEVVVDTKSFKAYGLAEKPLSVAHVGEVDVVLAGPEKALKASIGALIGKDVSVEIAFSKDPVKLRGRISAAEEGACADETEVVIVFNESDQVASALSSLAARFAEKFRFPAQADIPALKKPVPPPADDVLNDIAKRETGRSGRLAQSAEDGRSVARALAEQMALPYTDLEASGVDVIKVREFRRDFLLRHLFLPLYENDGWTKVAVVWELPPEAVAAVERTYGRKITYSVAPEEQVYSAIEHAFNITENRRRAARMGVALRVRVGMYDTSWNLIAGPVQGVTRNISASGILAACPPLQKDPVHTMGQRAGTLLFLPEYEKPLKAVGRIVRAAELSSDPPVHLYAVEINHMAGDDRRKLDVFRYTLMWGPHRLKVE